MPWCLGGEILTGARDDLPRRREHPVTDFRMRDVAGARVLEKVIHQFVGGLPQPATVGRGDPPGRPLRDANTDEPSARPYPATLCGQQGVPRSHADPFMKSSPAV